MTAPSAEGGPGRNRVAWPHALVWVGVVACGPSDDRAVSSGPDRGIFSSSAVPSPTVVLIDTNRTLTASPGEGVGVFTEYSAGGHWHVGWTCDSSEREGGPPCLFHVSVSVSSGAITQVVGNNVNLALSQSTSEVEAKATALSDPEGIDFDTAPGQPIQVSVRLNGVLGDRFFFFVQDGVVNGGFTGPLSDPVIFAPSSP